MRRNLRAVVAMLLVLPAAYPPSAPAAEPSVRVSILWVETGMADRFVRDVGLQQARDILKPLGILLDWRIGPPATESSEQEIRIVPLARRLGETGARRVLAATANRHGPGTVWLDWPGVAWVAGFQEDALPSARPIEKRRVGVALGRILAHELIHALLPELPHASAGLMDQAMREPLLDPATVDSRSRAALRALATLPPAAPKPAEAVAEGAGR
jgi:hypothetical protein